MSASFQHPKVAPPAAQAPFEHEIAQLIAEVTNLDIAAQEIDPAAVLFGEGLGLDSIDLLEIALAVSQRYGVALRSDDPANREIFGCLRNFSAYIAQHRKK
jgi:acyl carrier protein